MSNTSRMSVFPLGMSIATFFAITYILCISYGVLVSSQGMHQLFPMVLPGFQWITWSSFLLGLVLVFAYGWCVALVFVPIYNFFTALSAKRERPNI